MSLFPTVDIDAIQEELKLESLAIKQGGMDLPASQSVSLDSNEEAVVDRLRKIYIETKHKTAQVLSANRLRRSELQTMLNADQNISEIERIPSVAHQKMTELQIQSQDKLKSLRMEERKAIRQYNVFRALNRLINREAHYPKSQLFHWSIVMAVVLLESFINSYFFMEATSRGLIGGLFLALIISIVNVVVAVVFGAYILRYINHVDTKLKILIPLVGGSICLTINLLINLAAAHTRELIGGTTKLDIEQAFTRSIIDLKTAPFGVNDFEAWLLFVIGIVIAFFAIIKGYTSDDKYPGYSQEDRLRKSAVTAYLDAKQEFQTQIVARLNSLEDAMRGIIHRVRQQVREYDTSLASSRNVESDYKTFIKYLNDCCSALLKFYRGVNKQVRSSKPPAYFETACAPFSTDVTNLEHTSEEERSKDHESLLKKLDNIFDKNRNELVRMKEEYISQAKEFIRSIEQAADEDLVRESKLGMA